MVREQGDLSWWETINSWHGNPGPCKFTVPKELKDMTQTGKTTRSHFNFVTNFIEGSISLKVDFSKAIPGYSNLLKKKKKARICRRLYDSLLRRAPLGWRNSQLCGEGKRQT